MWHHGSIFFNLCPKIVDLAPQLPPPQALVRYPSLACLEFC
jgi:hypothetical protein